MHGRARLPATRLLGFVPVHNSVYSPHHHVGNSDLRYKQADQYWEQLFSSSFTRFQLLYNSFASRKIDSNLDYTLRCLNN